jgi:excisionase family DNA binding protein
MTNEIILSGISFEQLQDSIKTIVQCEVQKIVSGLTPAPEPAPELITRKETALILGISLPTLNDWTKTGIIPAQRIGTRIRYQRTSVYASLKDIETLKYRRV